MSNGPDKSESTSREPELSVNTEALTLPARPLSNTSILNMAFAAYIWHMETRYKLELGQIRHHSGKVASIQFFYDKDGQSWTGVVSFSLAYAAGDGIHIRIGSARYDVDQGDLPQLDDIINRSLQALSPIANAEL